MNQNDQQAMKKTFHNEMITLYKRIRKDLKYTPPQLFEMINKYGGYEAAIKFIITDMNTFVFTLLWENQRLDLSVEALITKESYENLFSDDVIKFCKKRLEDYNYAPKILPVSQEAKEPTKKKTKKEQMFDSVNNAISSLQEPTVIQKEHIIYTETIPITVKEWECIFANDTIFTAKNKDLLLRMYLMGGRYISHEALAQEEGYTSKYPFKEVITSIGKRIKTSLKIEMPTTAEGKAIPWHILFLGWFESNTEFSWSLRPEFANALSNLIESGEISTQGIVTKTTAESLQLENTYTIPTVCAAQDPLDMLVEDKYTSEDLDEVEEIPVEPDDVPDVEDLLIPALDLDDLPFEDEVYDALDHLYVSNDSDEFVDKPSREPLSPVSLDDLIDSIFDMDPPKAKTVVSKPKAAPVAAPAKPIPVEPKVPVKTQTIEVKPPVMTQAAKIEVPEEVTITETVNIPQNTKTLDDVRKSCLEYYGAVCELCGFDFGYTYGEEFEQLIEIYPIDGKPLESRLEQIDPKKEIIPICSNCKKVIESKNPHYTIEEIKNKMK